MKKCTKCEALKEETEFAYKNKKIGRLSPVCRSCQKIYRDQHYQDNKDYYKTKAKEARAKTKQWFDEFMVDRECVVCGEDERCCFDFHHLNPQEKEINIAQATCNAWSPERLQKEIDKCVILCANCHRKVHAGKIDLAGVI